MTPQVKSEWDSWVWLAAGASEKKRKGSDQGKQDEGSPDRRRKRYRKPIRPEDQGDEGEERVTYHGHKFTLEEYVKTRQFRFLHYYAGKDDPLGKAIREEAELKGMKVKVVSCEKESGVDLLDEQPFLSHCEEGKKHLWDGFHSGFPCTTFTKLRFRPAPGYPGPVRSKQHPHGLPGLDGRRQRECDEGTLHAARSAHLADLILGESRADKIRPAVTMENPPPSDHPEHLSAWEMEEVDQVIQKHQMTTVDFNTCAYQAHIPVGQRNFKPQRFAGTLMNLEGLCGLCPCGRGAKHDPIIGKEKSAASGKYPRELCISYAIKLLVHFSKIASLEFYNLRREDLEAELEELNKEEKRRNDLKRAQKKEKGKKAKK